MPSLKVFKMVPLLYDSNTQKVKGPEHKCILLVGLLILFNFSKICALNGTTLAFDYVIS